MNGWGQFVCVRLWDTLCRGGTSFAEPARTHDQMMANGVRNYQEKQETDRTVGYAKKV